MYILGLSCFYHDSAACLLKDGSIVAACQEERFSGIKHDWRFPVESIRYCLQEEGISIDDIDLAGFYEKPILKFERVLETFLAVAPRGYLAFLDIIPSWLKQKLWIPHILNKNLGYKRKLLYCEHHMAHAASSYFVSPFDEAAILTVDGVGEWATASCGYAKGNKITLTHEMRFPNSLGLLYSAITSFLGFKVNNDEYKVMGMAPYGQPEFYDLFLKELVNLKPDGSLGLNLKYFLFQYGRKMFNTKRFKELFGVPPRISESKISQKYFNIAASLQKVTETVILKMAEYLYNETRIRNLCLAGGVALNSVANGRLLKEGPFNNIFIQPAAGDAGGAVGAAYAVYHQYSGRADRHPLKNLYLGPSYSMDNIRAAIEKEKLQHKELSDMDLMQTVAGLLDDGKVIGWFQGRMEFGPRALGNRSILADPRNAGMKDILNNKVKFRESFRPFAPVVTEKNASQYFEIDQPSPYMLLTVPVKSDRIPAVTHVDRSARVQTLEKDTNPRLYALIREFEKLTGVPVLLNTSLNIKGEPIAMTPSDALNCFQNSGMDGLVLENFLLLK